jgi:glycosyltransferase involved in cell wall biosynthesis
MSNEALEVHRIRPSSLVLTVLNEEKTLLVFLRSVHDQTDLPREIVVVDGGSTDGTLALLRGWVPPAGVAVRVIERPGANISQGRNLAISTATAERLLVTDGGTRLDSAWVRGLMDAFEGAQCPSVVSGFFRATGDTLVERAIAFTATPGIAEIDGATFLPSSRSVAFTRSAWRAAGGYPEWLDYCEDLVFDLRLKQSQPPFAFAPSAMVTWSARPTIRAFMLQYYRYARGDGKASLWARRHGVRYAAYLVGCALLVGALCQAWLLAPLVAAAAFYLSKFWRRVWRARSEFGDRLLLGLALVPVIVISGDLAKMVGYPVGLRWRHRNRPTV